ncbi:RNA 2',3'-cyclic phosphodiesterase [Rhodanobacter glycinis]|uniref:RNA 2',3'-cyclic phosphodiesterase n=1 Tax=Rhodanobacter glycinis TaxID=582702 RepID=A0A502C8S4_9GAMM|nr:RNA 2',3'-cyclic phosphodiesterase [Rhodanobacter glycinis]TPG08409.1 RNA 2',3'-cyclic phosphodiesterase [Rhodanobacter glycinis]TPG51364.1 RNA 2',3'-cyclic phosphodiesterase [Rhodanobacter glycinis]
MSQQASLPGFAPAAATDRLFLAIFPDRDIAAQLAALAATQCAHHGLRGRPLGTERFHVTLFHLGDSAGLRQDVVDTASKAASRVQATSFELVFDQVASFAGRRDKLPFVLKADGGNAPLRAFHAELAEQLREVGLAHFARESFEPHVTLAYDARTIVPEAVSPVRWRAHEFVLIHSLLGQTRHIPLARWALV